MGRIDRSPSRIFERATGSEAEFVARSRPLWFQARVAHLGRQKLQVFSSVSLSRIYGYLSKFRAMVAV